MAFSHFMTDDILIPPADAVITPVLETMYEKRPTCFPHLDLRSGVYWHPVLGFRAQVALMLEKLADRAARRRLNSAEGTDLLDYVDSEFLVSPEPGQTYAEGQVYVGRSREGDTELPAGDILAGSKILRGARTVLGQSYVAAEYTVLADVHFPPEQELTVVIPIRATRSGSFANHPVVFNTNHDNITIPGGISNLAVSSFQAAGGSDGVEDPFVRDFARSSVRGRFGPTSDASRFGALASGLGVRRHLVFDHVETGTQTILIADGSWASSERWAALVQQKISESELGVGFGCKIGVGIIRNRSVSVVANASLRDSRYLAETTAIDAAVRKAVRSYFDDRPDWHLWNKDALCSAIANADPKILECSSAVIVDSSNGGLVSEIVTPDYSTEQVHLLLASNAVKVNYTGPA